MTNGSERRSSVRLINTYIIIKYVYCIHFFFSYHKFIIILFYLNLLDDILSSYNFHLMKSNRDKCIFTENGFLYIFDKLCCDSLKKYKYKHEC